MSNRFAPFIHHVHIADGFADDCDELIHRCLKEEPVTYSKFCKIWKEMNFASLYKERLLGAEIAEVSEEVLHIAKRYMVANTSNFEESVAGLYIVYGLLNLQPYKNFAALRIVPDDLPAISRIEVVARRERRYEVLYILGNVVVKGPCHYHVAQRERGAEPALRKYLEGYTGIDKQGIRPKGVFYRQNEELDIIRELSALSKQYTNAKSAVTDEKAEIERNLNYSDKNLATDLETSLKMIINGLIDEEEKQPDNETPTTSQPTDFTQSDAIQSIKTRAMKHAVGGVKYLMGVSERAKSKSPKKKPSSKSPKKRKNSKSPRGQKQKRKKEEISTDSDSSEAESISSVSTTYKITADDLNLYSDNSQDSFIEIQDVNFVGSLPVIVTPQNDDRIEIEIIDYCANLNSQTSSPKNTGISIKNSPEKSKIKKVKNEKHFEVTGPIGVFKIPEVKRVRKPKKELRNSTIKSKFKRLGILPVTDLTND